MEETIVQILTEADQRSVEAVEATLIETMSVGAPWFDTEAV